MPVLPPQPQQRTCAQCGRLIQAGERWYRSVPEHLVETARTRPVFGEMALCPECYAPQGGQR